MVAQHVRRADRLRRRRRARSAACSSTSCCGPPMSVRPSRRPTRSGCSSRFYVVCAVVTWVVFLRMQTQRAHAGEHVGRVARWRCPPPTRVLMTHVPARRARTAVSAAASKSPPRPTTAARRVIAAASRGQGASGQLRPAVHQGRDPRRHAARPPRPADIGAGPARRAARSRCPRRSTTRSPRRGTAAARDRRRARPGRGRALRLRADVPRGAVPGQQAGQGLPAHQPHRVELPAVHGQRRHRIQAVARAPTGRPAPTATSTTPTCSS